MNLKSYQERLKRILKKALTHETCCEHNHKLQQGFFEVHAQDWKFHSDDLKEYPSGLNLEGTVMHRVLKMDIPGFFVWAFPKAVDGMHRGLDEVYVVRGAYLEDGASRILVEGEGRKLVLDVSYADFADFFIRHLEYSRGFLKPPERGYRNGTLRFGCRHYVHAGEAAAKEE